MENIFNPEISQNIYLRNIRRFRKIKLFEAGIKSHVGIITLFNIEHGYFRVGKRSKRLLTKYYNLSEGKIDSYNPVPTSVKDYKKKKDGIFTRLFVKTPSIIVSFILMIIFICITPYLISQRKDMRVNYDNYLNSEYLSLSNTIIDRASDTSYDNAKSFNPILGFDCTNGITFFDNHLMRTSMHYLYDVTSYTEGDITYTGGMIIEGRTKDKIVDGEIRKASVFSFVSYISDGSNKYGIFLTFRGGLDDSLMGKYKFYLDVNDNNTYDSDVEIDFTDTIYYENNEIEFTNALNEDINLSYDFLKERQNELFYGLNNYVRKNSNYKDFKSFYENVITDVYDYSENTVLLWYSFVITTFLAIILGSIALYGLIKRRSMNMCDEYELYPRDRSAIVNNRFVAPPIKEGWLKIIGLLFIAATCWYVVLYLSQTELLYILNVKVDEKFLNFLKTYKSIFSLGPLVVVIFTTKNYIRDENPYMSLLVFAILTIEYFFLQIFIINRLMEATILKNFEVFIKFIPSNFMFAIFLLMAFAVFLFRTPAILNKRWKRILYRAQAGVITIIFILCYVIRLLSRKSIITIPTYLDYFLPEKLFGAELFGFLFIFSMYTFETIIKNKHGLSYLKQYKHTNIYYWIENIIIVCLLIVIAIFENNSFIVRQMNSIGVGKLKYAACLIPLLLLYHPRIGRLNLKDSIAYTVAIIFSMLLPYFIIGINIVIFLYE